jgi:hypothetical protein
MQFLKRGLMIAGAFALVAMLLTLAAPKRVHAAVATLVQVANTIGNPAITQDTSKTASQIVNLRCAAWSGHNGYCERIINGTGTFQVPSGQTLVVTSIVITPPDAASGEQDVTLIEGALEIHTLRVTNEATTQFVYPSGILYLSGANVIVTSDASMVSSATLYLNGYLTTN